MKRRVVGSAAIVTVLAVVSVGCTDGPRSVRPDRAIVLPKGIRFNSEASGPLEPGSAGNPHYDLELLGEVRRGGAVVAVMRGDATADSARGRAQPIARAGPKGLAGCQAPDGDRQLLLLSRDLGAEELCLRIAGFLRREVAGWTRQVYLKDAPVPGIGSVPVPVDAAFTARSYTSSAAEDPQRSVVVAWFPGDADTIRALAWWFGSSSASSTVPGAREVTAPAFTEIDDDPTHDAPVPDAAYTIKQVADDVVVVRCTGLTEDERADVLGSIDWR